MSVHSEIYEGSFIVNDISVLAAATSATTVSGHKKLVSPSLVSFDGHELGVKVDVNQEKNNKHMGVYMRYAEPPPKKGGTILIQPTFSLLNLFGEVAISGDTDEPQEMDAASNIGDRCFCSWSMLQKMGLTTGPLTIQWKVKVFADTYTHSMSSSPVKCEKTPSDALSSDLACLLNSEEGADVVIRYDAGERKVHKAILLARSEVFRRMFSHDMTESINGKIDLPDADAALVDVFLHFLYAGHLPPRQEDEQKEDVCLRLLPLAKKYEVATLVAYCSTHLFSGLCAANAAELLRVADMLNVTPLKQQALAFITSSADTLKTVQDTTGFELLDKDLVKEILRATFHKSGIKRTNSDECEFPSGSDWARMTLAQLRRACVERGRSKAGNKAALLERLRG